jgi:hypothetical protein
MSQSIFNQDNTVSFVEETHQYFDTNGNELTSGTRVIGKVKAPFDRERVSKFCGKKLAKESGISEDEAQKQVLAEWDKKKDSSIVRGNWIHNNLEDYLKIGKYDEKLSSVVEQLQPIIKGVYRFYPEALLYSLKYMVAGQSDLVTQRQRGKNSVFDFYDYKTNESVGIVFDSIGRKKIPAKHYNRYMIGPFSHIEDCNYYHYSLQLSLYAYMSELTWGIKIGRLAILYVDLNLKLHIYPVPYMRFEAHALLEYHKGLKPLPQITEKKQSVEEVEYEENEDTW